MPSAMRHDLSELPYSPTVWQRLGGPWSITLRAYLWTAPLGIIAQPVVEQSFWDDRSTLPIWFLISALGYLAFGLVLWAGWYTLIARRKMVNTSAILVISLAVVASMSRSATIGWLIEPFGLAGLNGVDRLPFGAFLGFAWVVTSAMIMDSKYRYQLHLETLVFEQGNLLQQNRVWLNEIRHHLTSSARTAIEDSHRSLQQAIREIAILSNDPKSVWAKVTPEIKRASIRIALADDKEVWTSEKNLAELRGSRAKAFVAISTTPFMNVPLVMTFTAIIAFLGASRLYPVPFTLAAVAFGVLLHGGIIQLFKIVIRRNPNSSTFRYLLMIGLLLVTSLLSTVLASPDDYNLLILRTIALTATGFEIIWIIATGFVQYGRIQRQITIDTAKTEIERLRHSLQFWQQEFTEVNDKKADNESPLLKVAAALHKAVVAEDLNLGLQAMEFSNLYFAEFATDFLGQDAMDIESELGRISRNWKHKAEVIWSVSGAQVDILMARRVIATLEVCASRAIRHGEASVISVDVKRLGDAVELKVSDNGQDYVESGSGLGVEILMDLTGGTWKRDRSGGLNIATAQFSITG